MSVCIGKLSNMDSAVPLRCSQCGESYTCASRREEKKARRLHMLVCTERQTKCQICLFYFHFSEMDEHIEVYHTSTDKTCEYCGFEYVSSYDDSYAHECRFSCEKCGQIHNNTPSGILICTKNSVKCGCGEIVPMKELCGNTHNNTCRLRKSCEECKEEVSEAYYEGHTAFHSSAFGKLRFTPTFNRPDFA